MSGVRWTPEQAKAAGIAIPENPGAGESAAPTRAPTPAKGACLSADNASPAEEELLRLCEQRWGERVCAQYRPIPGRRFSVDVAFPDVQLAVECDGWQYHGRFLKDFKRDRDKDRVMLLAGWRVLRLTAGEIRQEPEAALAAIADALAVCARGDGQ